ncbi:MAG: hypothetical protein HC906_10125 [Bacteroidales bacterium]|nr:hypothetical protein [Bacteroidales bacterium]
MKRNLTITCFLFLFFSLFPQEDLSRIKDKFAYFSSENFEEKLFMHTDRETYLTGEILWFKVYVTSAHNHHLIDLSSIAYVEVLDAKFQPVLQIKVKLTKGMGWGNVFLPATIGSGNYCIRAYTQWMRNFNPSSSTPKQLQL